MGILDAVVLAAASGPNNVSGRAAHGNCDDLRRDRPFAGKRPYVILGHCLLNGTIGPRVTLPDGPTIFIGVRMTFAARLLFLMLCVALPSGAVAQSKPNSKALPIEITPSVSGSADRAIFSNNGKEIITAGDFINLWDTESGRLIRTFIGHTDSIRSVSASGDGATIVSAGDDGKIIVWDAATGQAVRTLIHKADEGLISATVSRDGRKILSAIRGQLKLWDAESGKVLATIEPTLAFDTWFAIDTTTISADGRLGVATGRFRKWGGLEYQPVALLIDLTQAVPTWREISGFTSVVGHAMLSETGLLITREDDDTAVKIWNVATGEFVRKFDTLPSKYHKPTAISANGKIVVARYSEDHFHVWNADTGELLNKIERVGGELSLSPDGSHALIGRELFSIKTGMKLREEPRRGNGGFIAYSSDGGRILTSGRIWDARSGQLLTTTSDEKLFAASPANTIAVTDNSPGFLTRNISTGEKLQEFQRDLSTMSPLQIKFSRNGKLIAVVEDFKGVAKVFDANTGNRIQYVSGVENMIAVDISADGKKLLTADDGNIKGNTIKLWDVSSGEIIKSMKSKSSIWAITFFPEGTKAVIGAGNDVQIWELRSGRIVRQLRGHSNRITQVQLSLDGKTILSASWDGTIKLWSAETGNLLRTLTGSGPISYAQFSPDGKRIVSQAYGDGYRIWDVGSGAHLARIVDGNDGAWLVITPEGFFAASENGASMLSVVRGRELISSIEQVYQSLYRPDLVREKLAGDPRGLVREAATRLDLNKVIASGSAPEIRIASPAGGSVSNQQVNAEAELTDRGGGTGRVEWRVNGVTVGVDTPPGPAASQPVRLTRALALDPGRNTIEVVAYNAANLVASIPVSATVTAPAAAPAPGQPVAAQPSRLFLIAAGIDDYSDSRFKLAGSVRDARTLSQAFTTSGAGLYQSVNVKLLTDADVNKDRLDAAFKEFAAQATPADVFVLHLAGHGKTVDGRYYFVPRDFKVGNNSDEKAVNAAVVAQGIAQEQWQRWFASIPARKSMILFDTCESGSLTGDAAQTKALEQSAANDRLAQATGRSIITASSSTQLAFEYRGHGLFTYNLLDAMERADSDGNGTIEINELAAYVYAQVTRLSEQVFKKRQEPQIRIASSYPLTKQGRVLAGDLPTVAEDNAPAFQLAQTANLQIKPGPGATVVRSLNAQTAVTVLKSEGGWSLVASGGKPLGYVATRDLAPAAKAASR